MFVTYGDEAAVDATSATEDAYAAYQQYYQQQYAQQQVAPQPVHHGKPNPFAVLKNKQDLRSDLTAIMGEDAGVSLNFYQSIRETSKFCMRILFLHYQMVIGSRIKVKTIN